MKNIRSPGDSQRAGKPRQQAVIVRQYSITFIAGQGFRPLWQASVSVGCCGQLSRRSARLHPAKTAGAACASPLRGRCHRVFGIGSRPPERRAGWFTFEMRTDVVQYHWV